LRNSDVEDDFQQLNVKRQRQKTNNKEECTSVIMELRFLTEPYTEDISTYISKLKHNEKTENNSP
jgi:hypothetical protein